jgi:hypothetical protein
MARSLTERLGLKPGMSFHIVGRSHPIVGLPTSGEAPADLVLGFVPDAASVVPVFGDARSAPRAGGRLWFAYPKVSGRIATDITRDRGWDSLVQAGWLGVAQIALDETWSALRFRPRAYIPKLTRKA